MPRRYDERGICNLKSGRDSKSVDQIMKDSRLDLLSEINKMKFKSLAEEIQARSIAYDLDSYARKAIADHIRETGLQVTTYQSDLESTQDKMAKYEVDMSFHRKVLEDLQIRYLKSDDDKEKGELLQKIALEEEILARSLKIYNEFINTRNKIRTAIDRNVKYTQKKETLEAKPDEDGVFSVDDLDEEALDDTN